MMENSKKSPTKNTILIIFSVYLFFIFGIFFFSENINSAEFIDGYLLGGDSKRYINGSIKITNFELPEGKASSYLGYIVYLSIFQYFGLNLSHVVISQIFLTILSAICLYKITKKLSSDIGGLFCVCLYLFYFPLQIRNFFILTETIFICSLIFIIYFIVFYKKKYFPILIFFIIFYFFIRPHGILIIPSLFLAVIFWIFMKKKYKMLNIIILLLLFLSFPLYNFLNLHLENMKIIENIVIGGVIYGYESKNNFLKFDTPSEINNNIKSLLIFLKLNFDTFVIGFFKKLYFFYFRVRPYYSEIHNLYLILFNFIYIPLAIFGLFKNNKSIRFYNYFFYSILILFSLSIGLSFADWSGRFSLYIMPILFIFSGIGLDKLRNNILK